MAWVKPGEQRQDVSKATECVLGPAEALLDQSKIVMGNNKASIQINRAVQCFLGLATASHLLEHQGIIEMEDRIEFLCFQESLASVRGFFEIALVRDCLDRRKLGRG